jgi:hypothetical protein
MEQLKIQPITTVSSSIIKSITDISQYKYDGITTEQMKDIIIPSETFNPMVSEYLNVFNQVSSLKAKKEIVSDDLQKKFNELDIQYTQYRKKQYELCPSLIRICFPNGIEIHIVPNSTFEMIQRIFRLVNDFNIELFERKNFLQKEMYDNLNPYWYPDTPAAPYIYENRDMDAEMSLQVVVGLMFYKNKITTILSSRSLRLIPLNWTTYKVGEDLVQKFFERDIQTIEMKPIDIENLEELELPCLGYNESKRIPSETFIRESIIQYNNHSV